MTDPVIVTVQQNAPFVVNTGSNTVTQAAIDQLTVGLLEHVGNQAAHGTVGEVVGTQDVQTLINKSIDGSANTVTNLPNSALQYSGITINNQVISLGGSLSLTTDNIPEGPNNKYFNTQNIINATDGLYDALGSANHEAGLARDYADSLIATEAYNRTQQITAASATEGQHRAIAIADAVAQEALARQIQINNVDDTWGQSLSDAVSYEAQLRVDGDSQTYSNSQAYAENQVQNLNVNLTNIIESNQSDMTDYVDSSIYNEVINRNDAIYTAKTNAIISSNQYTDDQIAAEVVNRDAAIASSLNAAKAYSDSSITTLVNSAPQTLDTLKELADAIGDDPNFAVTVSQNVASGVQDAKNYTDQSINSEVSARNSAITVASDLTLSSANLYTNNSINELTTSDIEEGSNLYFKNIRALEAFNADTNGVNGGVRIVAPSNNGDVQLIGNQATHLVKVTSDGPAGLGRVTIVGAVDITDSGAIGQAGDLNVSGAIYTGQKLVATQDDLAANSVLDKQYTDTVAQGLSDSLDQEVADREQAILDEVTNRNNAISSAINTEVADRNFAISTAIDAQTTDTLIEGNVNLYYTDQRARESIGQALTAGAGVSIVPDSLAHTITVSNTGVLSVTGTSSEVEVSTVNGVVTVGLPNDVTIANNLGVNGNVVIDGDITVLGTQTVVHTQNTSVNDNLLYVNAPTTASITDVTYDATTVTYYCTNNFNVGEYVYVEDVVPSQFNILPTDGVYITDAHNNRFTVNKIVTGTYTSGGTANVRSLVDPDLGVVGGYYDGGYHHGGIFRDASDNGAWKVFKNLDSEPEGTHINTTDPTFTLADFKAGTFTGSSFVGPLTGNADTATKLASSKTINGIAFDGSSNITIHAETPHSLSFGTGLAGTSFDGSAGVTVTIDSTVATLSGSQELTNKTINASLNSLSNIPNSSLFYSKFTIGTTDIHLGDVTSSLSGLASVAATAFTGELTGNASTATKLHTSREINGVAFDGSANITITADAATLTGNALSTGVINSYLKSVGTLETGVWNASVIGEAYLDPKLSRNLITYVTETTTGRTIASSTDKFNVIVCDNSNPVTITLPTDIDDSGWEIGSYVNIRQMGTGQITVAASNPGAINLYATDNQVKTRVQYSEIIIEKISTNTWFITGDTTA